MDVFLVFQEQTKIVVRLRVKVEFIRLRVKVEFIVVVVIGNQILKSKNI